MRRLLLLLTIIILVVTPFQVGSINYRDKEMTLISFTVNLHSDIKKYLDQFDSYFPSVKNKDADKIIAKILEQSWGSMIDILQHETGMIILPITTFGSVINYDVYGFPDINISKAQRKGFSKYYMKVELQISPEIFPYPMGIKAKKDTTLRPVKLKSGEIKPVVTITLTTYPNNGIIPLGKYIGVAEVPSVWLPENVTTLDGLINSNNKTDLTTLMSLINEAISDLATNMLIK